MDHRIKLLGMADQQHQTGYIYEAFNAFHVRYYATENRDGKFRDSLRGRICFSIIRVAEPA